MVWSGGGGVVGLGCDWSGRSQEGGGVGRREVQGLPTRKQKAEEGWGSGALKIGMVLKGGLGG